MYWNKKVTTDGRGVKGCGQAPAFDIRWFVHVAVRQIRFIARPPPLLLKRHFTSWFPHLWAVSSECYARQMNSRISYDSLLEVGIRVQEPMKRISPT